MPRLSTDLAFGPTLVVIPLEQGLKRGWGLGGLAFGRVTLVVIPLEQGLKP